MISGPNALFSDSWVFVQHIKCDKLLSFDRVAAQATLQRCMNVDCKCRFTSPQRKRTELNSLNQLRQFELASQAPTPPFCPGTFHGCDFLKWTLQLYLLNLTKGAKFAGLRWSSNDQNAFSFRGASPPDQGLCPWTPLGALPPDPHYGLVLRTRHGATISTTDPFAPPMSPTELCPGTSHRKSAPLIGLNGSTYYS